MLLHLLTEYVLQNLLSKDPLSQKAVKPFPCSFAGKKIGYMLPPFEFFLFTKIWHWNSQGSYCSAWWTGRFICMCYYQNHTTLMMGNTVWPGCFQELPLPCNKQSIQEVVRQHAVLYCDLHTVVTHCLLETVISHHVCSAALKSINMWTSVQGVQGLEQEGQDQKMTK